MKEIIEKMARASFAYWRRTMDELGHHLDKGKNFENLSHREHDFALMNAKIMIEVLSIEDLEAIVNDRNMNELDASC